MRILVSRTSARDTAFPSFGSEFPTGAVAATSRKMIQTVMMPKRILVVADATRDVVLAANSLRDLGCAVELLQGEQEVFSRLMTWEPELVLVGSVTHADWKPMEFALRTRSLTSGAQSPTVFVFSVDSIPGPEGTAGDLVLTSNRALVHALSQLFSHWKHWQTHHPAVSESIACRDLRLDRDRHRVWLSEQPIHLTPTEFNLLWALASRPGYVLTRNDLSRACKGADHAVQTRTIDAHVKSIRRKLNDRAGWIETVHGIGYRFQENER